MTFQDFPPLHALLAEQFYRKQVAEIAAKLWTCLRLEQDAIPVAE